MDQKIRQLSLLNDELIGCTRCRLIKEGECPVQFQTGQKPKLMFVGFQPTMEDKLYCEPFTRNSRAGKNFRRLVELSGISLLNCHFTYVVKCATERRANQTSLTITHECYFNWLRIEIETLSPEYIFTVGSKTKECFDHFDLAKDIDRFALPDTTTMLNTGDAKILKLFEKGLNGYQSKLHRDIRL